MAVDEYGLTPKQRVFADEYILTHGNATGAYRTAGYKAKQASAGAHEILNNPKVKKYIALRTAEASTDKVLSVTEVLEELSSIIAGKKRKGVYNAVEKVTTDGGKSKRTEKLKTYEFVPKDDDRVRAAELLLKYNGALDPELQKELVKAQIRKANADAEVAEYNAKESTSSGTDNAGRLIIVRPHRGDPDG